MRLFISCGLILLFFVETARTQQSGSDSSGPSTGSGFSGSSTGSGPAPETDCEAIRQLLQVEPECIAGWPILLEQSEQGASRGSCRMRRGNERWNAILDAVRSEAVFCFEGCRDNISESAAAFEECRQQVNKANKCLTTKIKEAENRLCG